MGLLRTVHRWVRRGMMVFAVASIALLVWSVQARDVPAAWLSSDAQVRVERTEYGRLFMPAATPDPAAGVIFLPGGLVDPEAYVPIVRGLALEGVAAALVELPWRLAPTEGTRQVLWARIRAAREALGERRVMLAGHSRGGMLASMFAGDNPTLIDGLILIGTTHPRDRDLSDLPLPVLKLLGSRDCVATMDEAQANAHLLPPHAQWIIITGGNHRQFGFYNWQLGDCDARISPEAQRRETVAIVAAFVTTGDVNEP